MTSILEELMKEPRGKFVAECAEFLLNMEGCRLPPLGFQILDRLALMVIYAGDLEDRVGVLERSLDGHSVDMAEEQDRRAELEEELDAARSGAIDYARRKELLNEEIAHLKLTVDSEKQLRKSERETMTKNFAAELAAARARAKMSDDAANAAILAKDESERQRDLMRGELSHANQCLSLLAPLAEFGVKQSHPHNVSYAALQAIEECRRRKLWTPS